MTVFLRIYNFGLAFLSVGCTASATTITLQEGDLDNFPAPTTTNPYRLVIGREIMEVTGRDEATNRLTVSRAQEGTSAVSHPSLSLVSLRLTANGVRRMQDAINTLEQGLNTVEVRIDGGADVGQRARLHFLTGKNMNITGADDEPDNEVEVTLGVTLDNYTVATLPGAPATGDMAFTTDGRKTGEGAAAGTGVMVYYDGSDWVRTDDGTVVVA